MKKRGSLYNLTVSILPYGGEMALAIGSALVKQVSVLGGVALTSYFVGSALEQKLVNPGLLFVGLLVCVFLRALASFGEMYFAHDVAFRVIRTFRLNLFRKIDEISPAYTMQTKTGQLGQTLISDVEVLELFLAHTFSGFVVAFIVTAVIFPILWSIAPVLALMLLVGAVLVALVPYALKKRALQGGSEVRREMAEANSLMVEGVQGLREILTLNSKTNYQDRIRNGMNSLYDAQRKYGRKKGLEGMMTHIIMGIFTVSVMIVSAALVARGTISLSMYPVAVMLSTVVLAPVSEAAAVAQELGLVFAAANRIQTILNAKPSVQDTGKEICEKKNCEVSFKNVGFSYTDRETTLQDVSFSIKPGQTVVLVGHSGAGKSTCANLLLRYWDVAQGSIEINGKDIRSYSLDSLRDVISAVQQENYLFHTSIRDNIRLGCPDASDEEVEQAARAANAHEFICQLPEGYDTIAGEHGFRLSGGQRQRIAIARTLIRKTPILIFDEAVSSLDTENESYIQETLKTRLKDHTVLMIAHRMSTIKAADVVVELEKGRVKRISKNCETE